MSDEKKEFSLKAEPKEEKVETKTEAPKKPKKGPVYSRKGNGPLFIVKE